MNVFSFLKSAISGAGVGVADLALQQGQNLVPATIYGPRHNVRMSLGPTAPGFAKFGKDIVPVSILGTTGMGMQGTFELNPLAKEGR